MLRKEKYLNFREVIIDNTAFVLDKNPPRFSQMRLKYETYPNQKQFCVAQLF